MRVVSFVPSWTETLLEAGVEVVGRTRFCIHPKSLLHGIPAVGGTKDWDFKLLQQIAPDLILFDQEENPKWMAEQSPAPYLSSHITSISDLSMNLNQIAIRLHNTHLVKMAGRWDRIANWKGLSRWTLEDPLPGLLEWGRRPEKPIRNVIYVIWRNPWMTVSRATFIGSVLSVCGFGPYLRDFEVKYPKFNLADFEPTETLLLFSSEPYPFLRKKAVLNPISSPYAFVDGERFSWFGSRSLRFLENLAGFDITPPSAES